MIKRKNLLQYIGDKGEGESGVRRQAGIGRQSYYDD